MEFIIQSLAGSTPVLCGLVTGYSVSKMRIVKPQSTRLLLMTIYLGGTLSGIVIRYMVSDHVQVPFPLPF
jgi:hypothetical protein